MKTWEIEEKAIKAKVIKKYGAALNKIGLRHNEEFWLCSETLSVEINQDWDDAVQRVRTVAQLLDLKPRDAEIQSLRTQYGYCAVVTFFHGVE